MIKHLKTALFLVVCIAIGWGIGILWVRWRNPASKGFTHSDQPELITGIGDAPAHRGFTLQAAQLAKLPALLQQSHGIFATTIGVEYAPQLTRDELTQAVAAAHEKHLAVILLPPPAFAAENPYPRPLDAIAADAAAAHVDFLCLSWLNVRPASDYWRAQVQLARGTFPGKLVLAATPEILPQIDFLDTIDIFGAIGPFTLPRRLPEAPDDVTVHDLRVAWDCTLTSLESLARVHEKKLALLHMNIPAAVSARLPAPDAPPAALPRNPTLQQLIYEALLLETKGRAQYTDVLLFNWGAGSAAESADRDAPNNLPAVLARVGDAWDPGKPKPSETLPAPDAADPQADAGDTGADDGAKAGN